MKILTQDVVSMEDSGIDESQIIQVSCPGCGGDSYQVIGEGVRDLPVRFCLCSNCGVLGIILSDNSTSKISDDYDKDLRWLYGRAYAQVRILRTVCVQRIMASKVHLN